jgi:arylsulfatase A-like enzyme
MLFAPGCGKQQAEQPERTVLDLIHVPFAISELPDETATPKLLNGELVVPAGTELHFYAELPADSTVIADVASGPPLQIAIARAMTVTSVKSTVTLDQRPVRIEVPDGPSPIARVAVASMSGPGDGDATIRKLLIVSTTPDPSLTVPAAGGDSPGAVENPTPNIIVYLIDALRTDHLGVYGYERPVSPNIDAFASRATVFEDAVAQTSWTRSAVASMFTGLDPLRTGVIGRDDALSPAAETLAERLKSCGYTTAAFVFNGNAGEKYNLDQGFDIFIRSSEGRYSSDVLNLELFKLLDSGDLKQPFLLYIHTIDPHAPYLPPDEWRMKFAPDVEDPGIGEMDRLKQLKKLRKQKLKDGLPFDPELTEDIVALYDAEIAFNDATFGEFLEKLESMNILDGSVVIFLADHGEEFWDHGHWSHGESLYNEVLSIPLIIKHPSQQIGARSGTLVQQTDLFPTILDYGSCLNEGDATGRTLRSLVESRGQPISEPVFSVLDLDTRSGTSITTEGWKLIFPLSKHLGKEPQLFDRTSDPREMTNVFDEYPIVAGYMLHLLHQQQNLPVEPLDPDKAVVDEELESELRALGYVD